MFAARSWAGVLTASLVILNYVAHAGAPEPRTLARDQRADTTHNHDK